MLNSIEIRELLASRRFDPTQVPEEQVKLITIQQSLILSQRNFAALIGQPKAGKSSYLSIFLASACCMSPICGIEVHRPSDKPRFALFDTEQSHHDIYQGCQRILKLSGDDKLIKAFEIFTLRQDDPEFIIELIEQYILDNPLVGLIFIDGLLDLVWNFNDEKECKKLMNWLKRITDKYNVGVITILHTGKTTGQTIGHLGAYTDRACQSSLEIIKEKSGLITLRPKLLRSAHDFNPISIQRDRNGDISQVDYVEEPTMRVVSKKKPFQNIKLEYGND